MILITGASGTVGREVVKALSAGGTRIRAGYRTRPQNLPTGIDGVALDYDRPETIRPALAGVETLFLLSNTVAPEASVVDEARKAGVKRIVKLSVMNADKEQYTFAKWHRASEKHIESSGLGWTFLRPTGFMQNVINYMAGTIRGQGAIYSSVGDVGIAAIDARDIGAVAARVLTSAGHEGKAYELTGPTALTYDQVAEVLTRVLGKPVRYVRITPDQYKQAAVGAGTPEAYADALVDLERHYARGGSSVVSPAVKQLTGRDPIPFEQFARDNAAAWR